MNKNNFFTRNKSYMDKKKTIHPIWRGVGLVLMIFIPVLSFIASGVILDLNNQYHWFPIPPEFIIRWQDPLILMRIFITILVSFLVYALFMLITFFTNSLLGPRTYIPPDLPPLKRKR